MIEHLFAPRQWTKRTVFATTSARNPQLCNSCGKRLGTIVHRPVESLWTNAILGCVLGGLGRLGRGHGLRLGLGVEGRRGWSLVGLCGLGLGIRELGVHGLGGLGLRSRALGVHSLGSLGLGGLDLLGGGDRRLLRGLG